MHRNKSIVTRKAGFSLLRGSAPDQALFHSSILLFFEITSNGNSFPIHAFIINLVGLSALIFRNKFRNKLNYSVNIFDFPLIFFEDFVTACLDCFHRISHRGDNKYYSRV